MKIMFSVLRYELITTEYMNVGILFYNLDTDERRLETITRWNRLKAFDDELNINLFKILVNSMKEEISNSLFNNNIEFNIERYTKKFCNELRFSKILEYNTDNFEESIEYNRKNFLRYDYDKKDRPNREQQVKYMKKLMKSNDVKYSVTNPIGYYEERINYDYIIDKYAFKFFTFENKDLRKIIHTAKAWAYTAREMSKEYQTVFVYDIDVNDKRFHSIINILKNNAKVIKYDDTLHFILSKQDKNIDFLCD